MQKREVTLCCELVRGLTRVRGLTLILTAMWHCEWRESLDPPLASADPRPWTTGRQTDSQLHRQAGGYMACYVR